MAVKTTRHYLVCLTGFSLFINELELKHCWVSLDLLLLSVCLFTFSLFNKSLINKIANVFVYIKHKKCRRYYDVKEYLIQTEDLKPLNNVSFKNHIWFEIWTDDNIAICGEINYCYNKFTNFCCIEILTNPLEFCKHNQTFI